MEPSRIYVGHGLTGTNRDRPGLREALAACRAGDTLVVTKLDRLARSLPAARAIAGLLAGKPGFAADLNPDKAGDLLYTALSEEVYGLLIADCGWTPDAWQSWNVETITALLFPTRGRGHPLRP